MPPIITVENLGKRYRIRHQQQGGMRYKALRDVLADQTKGLARRLWSAVRTPRSLFPAPGASLPAAEDFWALKDVSFEVNQGDVVGIIGRNGAGKSTLLKILSRITEPTTGRVRLRGRVASLLEVGTGFHPELTGRENIFLNGAILGMARAEILRKFDEIVAFAEIEKFLDTPVKRYSSGMYVRLAFAVAAHLEPEILIVDEVLAVGDAEFQKKCLGKMQEVSRGGRTVLFVSHNMSAVRQMCSRGLVLEGGALATDRSVGDAIDSYLNCASVQRRIARSFDMRLDGPAFRSIQLPRPRLSFGETLRIETVIYSARAARVSIELEIRDDSGVAVAYVSTAPMHTREFDLPGGIECLINLEIGPLSLASGEYELRFWLIRPWRENYHVVGTPFRFTVESSDPGKSGFEFRQSYRRGAFTVPLRVDCVEHSRSSGAKP